MVENALPDDPTPKPLNTTPLDAWHRRLGARMVEFAGYAMPVQYQGVLAEHLQTALDCKRPPITVTDSKWLC